MDTLVWPLQRIGARTVALPRAVITRRPFDAGGKLDLATALLLPSDGVTCHEPPRDIAAAEHALEDLCLGLWLGTCFPNPPVHGLKIGWVSNFPATTMYANAFTASLNEVNLGASREADRLAEFKAAGYKIMLTINSVQDLESDIVRQADAVLVILRSAFDLEHLRQGSLDRLQRMVRSDTGIALHGGSERHLPNAPGGLGVDGLLHMPD